MRISEIFTSIQGEGIYAGVPSVFVRLAGCNLCCAFANGSLCDSIYASHPGEADQIKDLTPKQVAWEIMDMVDGIGGFDYSNAHIVFTGGEPLLQQDSIAEVIGVLREIKCDTPITIETNGTILPKDKLLLNPNILFSVSPKLSSSCCFENTNISQALIEAHKKLRINIEVISRIALLSKNYQLKFVYSGVDCVNEIQDIIMRIEEHLENNMPEFMSKFVRETTNKLGAHTMLMPEGIDNESLNKLVDDAVEACIANGWRFSDRMHIRLWGNERAK